MSAAKRAKRPQNAFFGWVSELVHEHRARLVRIARREGVRGADALDVIQDVFVAFLELPQARSLAGDADGSGRVLSVLTRRLLDEVKGDDVGRALGLTPGHVATLLHRAKADLRDCIERGEASMRPASRKIGASRSARRSR